MKPLFVAEVSSNHNQNLARCFDFIDKATEIGCGAVKFQLFRIEELFAPEILNKSEEHRKRKQWELPVEFLDPIAKRCKGQNIQFACTPFYLTAVKELLPYVDFYKIASYEILWKDLLVACARTGKPVVISTGMATLEEIDGALETLIAEGCRDLTVLHCVSGYPTPVNECNLAAIETLRNAISHELSAMRLHFGWSDHSVQPAVIYRAIHHWNASIIEFHLDLDATGDEFKTGHCWLPDQIRPVIEAVQTAFEADGSGEKMPAPTELSDKDWRADPIDGLRPLKSFRKNFGG